ncbi:hypothetical protein BXY70_3395 [Roseovarius halotolerans]|uniref:Uncharacterized protein n=1 Tax=Roseovarius halotolerans TaxID=505353 RepID=A0A1X6ZQ82_9RHOB|nr:hypothetical protein [Roseovarius halotolerans]RKT28037.1 hypothetical protein BXY70_3395 [Roseovarius halotolerans]SLN58276.1 hypothetical protein ROH8110_03205 [Roseovarius halotolerans]
MFSVFAKSFMTATRNNLAPRPDTPSHWPQGERFDNRARAEFEAHREARRRD